MAVTVLSRLLVADGWSYHELAANGMPGAAQSMKGQILGVINAVSYMRSEWSAWTAVSKDSETTESLTFFRNTAAVPLAAINFVVIFVKLIFG